ncbi:molybdenum cofactor guanylyltransferase [Salinibaculum salinum]|uniref:molybdenum cofactor guanylyltransferase n=1 Tax=Salinibaculum salinum TaxID=3131996 RepID=UPI0030ED74A2
MTDSERSAVVLAGGYSIRFGIGDKALAAIDGKPMLVRVVDRLTSAVDTVLVSCRAEQRSDFERALGSAGLASLTQFAIDPVPDRGPLAGIRNSFERVDSEYAAVVACDMPRLDPTFLQFLFDRADGSDAVVPELRGGHLQPMHAVYHVERVRSVADQLLASDRRSLHGAFDRLDTTVIPAATVAEQTDWRSLHDVNSPADLDSLSTDSAR